MNWRRVLLLAPLLAAHCAVSLRADEPQFLRLTRDGHFKQRPVWSPNGKQFILSRHRSGKIGLVLYSGDGPELKSLGDGKLPQYDAVWSPDGTKVALTHVPQSVGQGNLEVYVATWDEAALQFKDLKKVAGDQGKLSHEEWPAWSPDGKRIAYTSTFQGNQEIYVVDLNGENRVRVTSDAAIDAHPAWSPDGKRIVFATNRYGDFEIAAADPDGSNIVRLTESRGMDDYPIFSPDGKRIAFTSNRDGNYEIYMMNADGSGVMNVTQDPALDNFPAWTPEGLLSFVSNRDAGFDVYLRK